MTRASEVGGARTVEHKGTKFDGDDSPTLSIFLGRDTS